MIIYYRKVTLIHLDYREELEREEKLAWCEPQERLHNCEYQHIGYEPETFDEAEKRLLATMGEAPCCDHVQLCQVPSITRRQNLNPHGLT